MDVEAAIDEVYAAPFEAFVSVRQEAVRRLRAAGHREAAGHVKSLAKPGATAWAVNQAWWRARSAFEDLLRAGEAVRAAQADALMGRAADVRTALATRAACVRRVADVAVASIDRPAGADSGDTARRRIVATLEAIATSGVPEGVRMGRLTTDLSSTGIDVLSALAAIVPPRPAVSPASDTPQAAPVPARAPTPAAARPPAAAPPSDRRLAERAAARAALAETEAAAADADRQHREAEALAESARAEAVAARARLDAAEAEVAAAREALARAGRRADDARATAVARDRERERARAAVGEARTHVSRLERA